MTTAPKLFIVRTTGSGIRPDKITRMGFHATQAYRDGIITAATLELVRRDCAAATKRNGGAA